MININEIYHYKSMKCRKDKTLKQIIRENNILTHKLLTNDKVCDMVVEDRKEENKCS